MVHFAGAGRAHAARTVQAVHCRHFSAPGGYGGIAGTKISGVNRFYKKVNVQPIELDSKPVYTITLDDKAVKTPMRTPLHLPAQSMAYAIAREWDAQRDKIKPALMPLMTLASTAIDLEKNATRQEIIDEMLHYLHSDTLCYQVTADQSEKLAKQQQKKWDPIRKWFTTEFVSSGELDVSHGTIGKLVHDASLVDSMRKQLEECDVFELVPLRAMTKECKSLITAWALFKRRITPKEAMELSRVEEEFQINNWGLVEGGHDVDRVNCAVNLSSASFFIWLLHNHQS